MKHILLIFLAMTFTVMGAFAQDETSFDAQAEVKQVKKPFYIQVTPMFGYTTGNDIDMKNGDRFKVDGAASVGMEIAFPVADKWQGLIAYNRMGSQFEFQVKAKDQTDNNSGWVNSNMSMDYFHIGARREFGDYVVKPYAALTLGTTLYNMKENGTRHYEDEWMVSGSLAVGARYMISKHVGFRLQARLHSPIVSTDRELFRADRRADHFDLEPDTWRINNPDERYVIQSNSILPQLQQEYTFGVVVHLGK